MTLSGIGLFIDQIAEFSEGDAQAFSKRARQAGLQRVIFRVGNGNTKGLEFRTATPFVSTLKDAGVQVWGWQQLHGVDPVLEARQGVNAVRELTLDGFVVFAGQEFEQPGKDSSAREVLSILRAGLDERPLALSAFDLPSLHPHFPWQEFLSVCDVNMPQLEYLDGKISPVRLERCLREFENNLPNRAIIPVGKFDGNNGQKARPGDVQSFVQTSQELNMKGVNLWGWDLSQINLSGGTSGAGISIKQQQPAQSRDFLDHYFAALNNASLSEIKNFYGSRCALVTATHTYVGREQVQSYYQKLLSKRLPGAFFDMTSSSGAGTSRNFRWRARARSDIFRKNLKVATPKPFNKFTDAHKIYKGVHFKRQALNSPRYHVVHVASVDLNEPGIGLMVTPHNGLGRTTSNFLDAYHVQMAVNGDEWLSWSNPKGLAVSDGIVYSAASSEPSIYISRDNKVQFGGDPPASIWNAISGSHTLVTRGQMSSKLRRCSKPEVYCQYRAPRTSIGITADNKLILIVVQGPSDSLRNALTLREMAELNLKFGAVEAINMDGGGSSAMAVDNYGRPRVVNSPSGGSERAVSNHLGVIARFLDPATSLIVDDGNDTIGMLDGKIVHHYTSYSIGESQIK